MGMTRRSSSRLAAKGTGVRASSSTASSNTTSFSGSKLSSNLIDVPSSASLSSAATRRSARASGPLLSHEVKASMMGVDDGSLPQAGGAHAATTESTTTATRGKQTKRSKGGSKGGSKIVTDATTKAGSRILDRAALGDITNSSAHQSTKPRGSRVGVKQVAPINTKTKNWEVENRKKREVTQSAMRTRDVQPLATRKKGSRVGVVPASTASVPLSSCSGSSNPAHGLLSESLSVPSGDLDSVPLPKELCSASPMCTSSDHSKSFLHSMPEFDPSPIIERSIKNIDRLYSDSMANCPEYARRIYATLRDDEAVYRPVEQDFMHTVQKQLVLQMREILIDWLVEVAEEYRLSSETLYLAKNFLDRYLSLKPVSKGKMQLVGLTALYVAAKFEEMFPPPVDDMVYISDNTYTRDEVLGCEEDLLNTLNFSLCCTTEKNFLRRFQMAAAADIDAVKYLNFVVVLSNFLCERSLQEYEFVQFSHSTIAAGALALALHTLSLPAWTKTLSFYSGYTESDVEFQRAIFALHKLHRKTFESMSMIPLRFQAVNDKYLAQKNLGIAKIPPCESLPSFVQTS